MQLDRVCAVLLGFWLLMPPLLGAESRSIQIRGSETFDISRDDEGWRLRLGDGSFLALPIAASSQIARLYEDDTGWLIAAIAKHRKGRRLELLQVDRERQIVARLPGPLAEPSPFLEEPLFVVGRSQSLRGLAWLAGESASTAGVYAARAMAGGWSTPVVVSPSRAGSQGSLTGVDLLGTALLVWVAYDGTDDEVMWSRGDFSTWSAPQRISDNAVPDITPALIPQAYGALAAWSWYDGNDYRIVSSRFDGTGWTSPRTLGSKGTTRPTFFEIDPPRLLVHQAVPTGWTALELDAGGTVFRRSTILTRETRRPRIGGTSQNELIFEWPDGDTNKVDWSTVADDKVVE